MTLFIRLTCVYLVASGACAGAVPRMPDVANRVPEEDGYGEMAQQCRSACAAAQYMKVSEMVRMALTLFVLKIQ